MTDAQRYDLDPDPSSRSMSPGPDSCKIVQITPSGIPSQNVPQNWAFATQSEISGANLCESIFSTSHLLKTNVMSGISQKTFQSWL